MKPDEWIAQLQTAYESQGAELSANKRAILLQQLPPTADARNPSEQWLIRSGIATIENRIPKEHLPTCEELLEVLHREFFRRVSNGQAFGDLARLEDNLRTWFDRSFQKYGHSHRAFFDVIRTSLTFYREVHDLFPKHYNLILSQVLHCFRLEMKGAFFPARGPHRIPFNQRVQAQRALFDRYAPDFDQADFFEHNPVLRHLKAQESKLPSIVMLVVCLAGAFIVPQRQLWGKIVFWLLMAIVVLCLTILFPFIRRLISGNRAAWIEQM